MPMNDLLARHQLARLNAQNAASPEDRATFAGLEAYYAERIEAWREALDLPRAGWPAASDSPATRAD